MNRNTTRTRRQTPESIAHKLPAQILYLRAAAMRIVERLDRLETMAKRAGL